jgi:hypothetical protein
MPAEFRVIADSREEVKQLVDMLKREFPRAIVSTIKINDSRPGYRAYLTVFTGATLDDHNSGDVEVK